MVSAHVVNELSGLSLCIERVSERVKRHEEVQRVGRRSAETWYFVHVEVSSRLVTAVDQQRPKRDTLRDLNCPKQDVLQQEASQFAALSLRVNAKPGQQEHRYRIGCVPFHLVNFCLCSKT